MKFVFRKQGGQKQHKVLHIVEVTHRLSVARILSGNRKSGQDRSSRRELRVTGRKDTCYVLAGMTQVSGGPEATLRS